MQKRSRARTSTTIRPGFNDLVVQGKIQTTLGAAYPYDQSGHVHQLMGDGNLPEGNVSVLINAPTEGLTDLP